MKNRISEHYCLFYLIFVTFHSIQLVTPSHRERQQRGGHQRRLGHHRRRQQQEPVQERRPRRGQQQRQREQENSTKSQWSACLNWKVRSQVAAVNTYHDGQSLACFESGGVKVLGMNPRANLFKTCTFQCSANSSHFWPYKRFRLLLFPELRWKTWKLSYKDLCLDSRA